MDHDNDVDAVFMCHPPYPDFLIAWATASGRVAVDHVGLTPYTEILCEELIKAKENFSLQRSELLDVLVRVKKMVREKPMTLWLSPQLGTTEYTQIPNSSDTVAKSVYFPPDHSGPYSDSEEEFWKDDSESEGDSDSESTSDEDFDWSDSGSEEEPHPQEDYNKYRETDEIDYQKVVPYS